MMEPCVTLVASSLFMASDGNALNAPIMICVQFVIMVTNTTLGIGFTELQHLAVKGNYCVNLFQQLRFCRMAHFWLWLFNLFLIISHVNMCFIIYLIPNKNVAAWDFSFIFHPLFSAEFWLSHEERVRRLPPGVYSLVPELCGELTGNGRTRMEAMVEEERSLKYRWVSG